MTLPVLPNAAARRLFLSTHALAESLSGPAGGADLARLIDRIGFVQVDSIAVVDRAHHMILSARRSGYRPAALTRLLERDRALFEHWTHDASILPVGLFAHWRHRFARDEQRLQAGWQRWFRPGYEAQLDGILDRIARDGPVSSAEVGADEPRGRGGWWDWHPSKTALEWLWRTGRLAVTRREGFRKLYDLTERVIPEPHLSARTDPEETRDWACAAALDRLGFATPGEIAAFWKAVGPAEAADWCRAGLAAGRLQPVQVEGADGRLRQSVAWPGVADRAAAAPDPPGRLRVLSPFDPCLRDRDRAERLFGFRYRIEVFVPEAQRRYGYYVFPLLEGDRLVGRIDMKAQRDRGRLVVRALWPEPRLAFGTGRSARLMAELQRIARFAGCTEVEFLPGWRRDGL
jgi:hypothetical protein